MKYLALICARGGSKGLPGKNIMNLNGLPLVAWSIKVAKEVDRISKIVVSTDTKEIAKISMNYGAEVPFIRPKYLSEDESSEWEVWKHCIKFFQDKKYHFDGLVIIPPTAPLRNFQDINNCINEYEKGDYDAIITVTDSHRNPYFNMIKVNQDNTSSLVISKNKKYIRRQDTPEVYDMTTVAYVVRPKFVLEEDGIFDGLVKSVHIPLERAVDIDTIFDFEFAKYLISKNNSK